MFILAFRHYLIGKSFVLLRIKRFVIVTANSKIISQILICILMAFAPHVAFPQKAGTKKYTVNQYGIVSLYNNKLTYNKGSVDTIEVAEPDSDKELKKIIKTKGWPVKLDGKAIHDEVPAFKKHHTAEVYLFNKLRSELLKLPNGRYTLELFNMIIDENGKICAFSYEGISASEADEEKQPKKVFTIDKIQGQQLFQKICDELVHFPAFEAPVVKGKKVVSVSNPLYPNQFWINNNKILVKQKDKWQELPHF